MPAISHLDMEVTSNKTQLISVEFTDMLGQKFLVVDNYQLNEGDNTIGIELENFASGTYLYSIISSEKVINGNLIILKP